MDAEVEVDQARKAGTSRTGTSRDSALTRRLRSSVSSTSSRRSLRTPSALRNQGLVIIVLGGGSRPPRRWAGFRGRRQRLPVHPKRGSLTRGSRPPKVLFRSVWWVVAWGRKVIWGVIRGQRQTTKRGFPN